MATTDTDFLIVGQGICGTVLSYQLVMAGYRVLVAQQPRPASAGQVASGLMNPVTGKRLAKAADMDALLPAAIATYRGMEQLLGVPLLQPLPLIEFFKDEEHAGLFRRRAVEFPEYLSMDTGLSWLAEYFHFPGGAGKIDAWLLDIRSMLSAWAGWLGQRGLLMHTHADWQNCKPDEQGVTYNGVRARYLICCEGTEVVNNPFFPQLPLAFNKGEALTMQIPGLPRNCIFHNGLKITPWGTDEFWVGSSFEWAFTDVGPSAAFRSSTEVALAKWLKLPFTITGHMAAIRPATITHAPLVLQHADFPHVALLNGMGAKGCVQAPTYAQQLINKMMAALH